MIRVVIDTNVFVSAVMGGLFLPLKTFREIPIISTREFLDWLDRIKA